MPGLTLNRPRPARYASVALLILGLSRTPVPMADFHNIRHHHNPGQVCRLHDHLLRYHPNDNSAPDQRVLHWHWLFPWELADHPSAPGKPAIHAHTPVGLDLTRDDGPQLTPSVSVQLVERATYHARVDLPLCAKGIESATVRAGPARCRAFTSTFPAHPRLTPILQRWVC